MKKPARAGFFLTRPLLGEGVRAQALRKIDEWRDAARFGAVTPVLELAQQLFLRGAGALPERDELVAHGDGSGQRARIFQRLGKPDALSARKRLAAEQGALQGAQHLRIARRPVRAASPDQRPPWARRSAAWAPPS